MPRQIDENSMNRFIAELCAARAAEAAVEDAHAMVQASALPYSDAAMKTLCLAGEKMRIAHAGKMAAWDRMRDAVAPPGYTLDNYGNTVADSQR